MATMDTMHGTDTSRRSLGRTPWVVAALIILAAGIIGFGALWLIERNEVQSLDADVTAAEADLVAAEATTGQAEASLATAEAEVAALEAQIASVTHPQQAEVQALYDDFLAAIADPDAATIEAMFLPSATNTNALGTVTKGAEEIGLAYESFGSLKVTNPDALIVKGDGILRAAMRGEVVGGDGLLIATIIPTTDGLKFREVIWYG